MTGFVAQEQCQVGHIMNWLKYFTDISHSHILKFFDGRNSGWEREDHGWTHRRPVAIYVGIYWLIGSYHVTSMIVCACMDCHSCLSLCAVWHIFHAVYNVPSMTICGTRPLPACAPAHLCHPHQSMDSIRTSYMPMWHTSLNPHHTCYLTDSLHCLWNHQLLRLVLGFSQGGQLLCALLWANS